LAKVQVKQQAITSPHKVNLRARSARQVKQKKSGLGNCGGERVKEEEIESLLDANALNSLEKSSSYAIFSF